jgi:hypothetical protein
MTLTRLRNCVGCLDDAKAAAEKAGAYGGKEAADVERNLEALHLWIAQKEGLYKALKKKLKGDDRGSDDGGGDGALYTRGSTTPGDLREAARELEAVSAAAAKDLKIIVRSMEYEKVAVRIKKYVAVADAREEMARVTAEVRL